MAVVTLKSDLYRDEAAGGAVLNSGKTKGRMFTATGKVTNAATDEAGSTYLLKSLPSHAILDERTAFDVQNDGFAQIVIGTKTDTDALIDQARATENTITPLVFGDANHGLELWEMLGLPEDPGGFIDLYKHAEATATGAGEMLFRLCWME